MGSGEEGIVNLEDALSQLAQANSQIELLKAHSAAQREIKKQRRKDGKELGPLAQTYMAAMQLWAAQKADGVSHAERVEGLKRTLIAAWPKSQFAPPANICIECHDVGWLSFACTPERPCGRPFRIPGSRFDDKTGSGRCTGNHDYVSPCFCAKGRASAASMQPRAGGDGDDFTQSTKGKKQRGFSQLGR